MTNPILESMPAQAESIGKPMGRSDRARSCWPSGRFFALLLTMAAMLGWARISPAQTPEAVNRAIDRGIDLLKSKQRLTGAWDDLGDYEGGVTSLATLALLSCDVPANDDRVVRALDVLRRLNSDKTYVVALQTMAFEAAKSRQDDWIIRRNAQWLMEARRSNGMWTYSKGGFIGGGGDNSNTQFALLGLQAAADAGVPIPAKFWNECRGYWITTQNGSGGWGYQPGGGPTGSMTAAGISSLKITGRELDSVRRGVVDGKPVRCDGAEEDANLRRAIDWFGRVFAANQNPGNGSGWLFYYLYGAERAGRLTGERFFGTHDWYREGCNFLIRRQAVDGSWDGSGVGPNSPVINTSFALLFLSKGRIPILVNKLKYGQGNNWAKAPNDIHNLTNFMADIWKKRLNWQIVDVQKAKVEDLMQAPVLHISGHLAPRLADRDKKLLRDYVEQGGVIVADANCSVESFDQGFRDLCREIFPEPGQELRRLDSEHGVWRSLFDLEKMAPDWPLFGIELGCRTVLFYSPEDLSCQWEHEEDLADPGSGAMPAFRLGANLVAYAAGPEDLQDKLAERKVVANKGEDEIQRNFLQIAKIKHNGDWNPAPMAVRNLMASLRDVTKIDVVRQQREIELLDPNLFNYPLVYMHGRNRFSFTVEERGKMLEYLKSGGVLFADACCGSERFDAAFREFAQELFPDKRLTPIPIEHELFSRDIGYDIRQVKFSKTLQGREGPPIIEGIELDGRYAILYSRYDIGCALEKHQGSDCKGYSHESAVRLAINFVLYALKQ